jgi:hypothetical protein
MLPTAEHLRLGIERPGISIDLAVTNDGGPFGHVSPVMTAVRVSTPSTCFLAHFIRDLRGYVTIRNPQDALRFVRMGTSRYLVYTGIGEGLEVDSVSQAMSRAFNEQDEMQMATDRSGELGVLSDADYRADGFQPPHSTQQGRTCRIRRWVCVMKNFDGHDVQLWEETVGGDGSYARKVLTTRPVPTSHGEQWFVYGLK